MTIDERRLTDARKPGFGLGLLKGMAVTLKHLFKHNTVIQYPETKQDLPARSRGVIALKEENCTVCMLCARECPDWCIYIDSHKETLAAKRQGGRPRKRNVLDRFAIDYALCMYCGICVEVCPYDALFWSREFEYSEYDIRELTHEKEKLSDWMATVLPPPELEDGAELPGRPAAAPTATQAPARAATPSTKPSQTSSAAEARPEQAAEAPKAPTAAPTASKPETTEERAPVATSATQVEEKIPPEKAETTPEPAAPAQAVSGAPASTDEPPAEKPSSETRTAPSGEEGPAPAAPSRKAAPEPSAVERPTAEELDEIYARTLEEQLAKGSSPPVAEARAKVARVKAERGVPRPPTPVATDHPVPSAPTKGEAPEPTPSGAPQAEEPRPQQGPVAPTPQEGDGDAAAAPAGDGVAEGAAPSAATESGESASEPPAGPQDPEEVYNRVLAEERAKGSSEAVALGRAKAARVRAAKGTRGPGG
jgi:formate hydrogenlyase subunit 6/NADH:ubiquinone oxidoreductase subunit I